MQIDFSPKVKTRLEATADYIYEQTKSKKPTRKYLQKNA